MNKIVKRAQKLKKTIEEKQHPEYNLTKISGCQLSRSDVDIAIIYLEEIIENDGIFPGNLMSIYNSEIKKLFTKYELPTENYTKW